MSASADRNLLFGLLALHMDFISRDQLLDGMNAWLLRKRDPLARVLQDRGALAVEDRRAVDALVERHLARHGGDAQKSLAAVRVGPEVREDLSRLDDADVQAGAASLARAPAVGRKGPVPHRPPPAPAPPMPAANGATRYRKLRLHAVGGVGEVHVALDEELGREVALKEIQPQHADRPDFRARFLREAQITGHLEHPGIVPVHGLGAQPDGRPCYAMRLVRGESLHDAITRFHRADDGRRDPSERELSLRGLLNRFVAVCNAVAYAHSRGVVHRDLKPGNVMLGEYGETLVVDWGLAKSITIPEGATVIARPVPTGGGSAPTELGQAVGTPAYMPPEQARGELGKVDHRSDVFALGATLYCLLTGRPPYQRDGVSMLAAAAECDHPPARRANPRVPAALEAVCARAMAEAPGGRYQSPRELAADVERWLADEPVSARAEPLREKARRWARRNRPLVTSGVVLLLASVVGLAVGLGAVRAEQARTEEARGNEEKQRLEAEANLALAKKAVDECFGIAKTHPLLKRPQLGDELHQLKRLLLVKALPLYEALSARRPGGPGSERDVWDQHFRVGYIQHELGSKEKALDHLRQAERTARQLVKAQPDEANYRDDLALTLTNLGVVREEMGQPKEALESHAEAIELYRALVKALPPVPAHFDGLANALNNRGILLGDLGKRPEALKSHAEAAELGRAVVKAQPGSPAYKAELARTLNSLGILQRALGQPQEAQKSYAEAAELYRAVRKAGPGVPAYRYGLAATLNNQGNLRRGRGQPKEALESYAEAVGLYRALESVQPGVPVYKAELARALNNQGILLDELGKRPEALGTYAKAIDLYRALAKAQPRVPAYKAALARALNNQGLVQSDLGQPQEAQESYAEAAARAAPWPRPTATCRPTGRSWGTL